MAKRTEGQAYGATTAERRIAQVNQKLAEVLDLMDGIYTDPRYSSNSAATLLVRLQAGRVRDDVQSLRIAASELQSNMVGL